MRKFLTLMATSLLALTIMVTLFSTSLGEVEITLVDFSDFPPYESDKKDVYSVICSDMFFAGYGVEGDIVSFEGYVDYHNTEKVIVDGKHTVQDILKICPGDFSNKSEATWGFVIKNMVEKPTCYYDSNIAYGENVLVTATLKGRSDDNMVMLDHAHVERRSTDTTQPKTSADEQTATDDASFDEEFSSILEMQDPHDERIEQFAKKHYGKTIEFKGWVYDCDDVWPDKYNIKVCAGQFKDASTQDTAFLLKGVTAKELGFDGDKLPTNIKYGSDVLVIAQITGHDDWEDCLLVAPSLLEKHNPLMEGLDTSIYTELAKKSKGDSVKALQQRLVDLKYFTGKADSKFGNKTVDAIKKFQSRCDLEITGIADAVTQAILFSENAPEAKLTISCSSMVVGSSAKTVWFVDGKKFALKGNKTKIIKTLWGTYKFDAYGNYEKIED